MQGNEPLCVAVTGGKAPLGRGLAARLSRRCAVRVLSRRAAHLEDPHAPPRGAPGVSTVRCELLSVPRTEVALAAADVLVHLVRPRAGAGAGAGRSADASAGDLAWLMADSVARAAPRTSVRRIVACADEQDERVVAALRASGLPVAVLQRGGDDEADALDRLEALVHGAELPALEGSRSRDGEAMRGEAHAPEVDLVSATSSALVGATSIQRHVLPGGWSARDVADAYFEWLGTQLPLVRTERRGPAWIVRTGGLAALRLRFADGAARPGSHVFDVSDGSLLRAGALGARFEFRVPLGSEAVFTVLHGFAPSLPWAVYRATQALLHAATLRAFGRWLAARPAIEPPVSAVERGSTAPR